MKQFKIALVHDFLTAYGGAERVLEVLTEMFPEAPIYTLLYDKEKMRGKFSNKAIYTSFLQKFPGFLRRRQKYLLPFLAVAPETFDLRDFDLVISSSGAWAKGIVTRLNTVHVSYIHSPMRFAWDVNEEYLGQQKKGKTISFMARAILNYIRVWDKVAADRPDYLIANSKYTQSRIKKYYGRDSVVVYPPVNHETHNMKHEVNEETKSQKLKAKSYFLVVSRLSPYKKVDVIVEAFNKLELPLMVVGEGQQESYLRSIAGNNIKIIGWQSEEKIRDYYRNARAFVFAGVDDFGLSPLEAMSYGVPVISIREGGIKEALIEGKTGEFFNAATPEVIADGVRRFRENEENYDRECIRQRAGEFGKERFRRELREYLDSLDIKITN